MKTENVEINDGARGKPANDGQSGSTHVFVLNGEQRESAAPDLAALLAELDVDAATVIAEHNGRVIDPARFAGTVLSDGDVIELVRFVGGG